MTNLATKLGSAALVALTISGCVNTAQPPSPNNSTAILDWHNVDKSAINQLEFKPVDKSVVQHDIERRGFVSVPLDYANKNGKKIDIFYRLMPSKSRSLDDKSKPILVIINGGPASPSSGYRPLDFNYDGTDERGALNHLDQHFRLLSVDQRGTGHSAPLNLDNANLSAAVIAKYFDADEHARDHAAVIEQVIPKGEVFFIIARSYGGHIGFQYLTLNAGLRKPTGMILSSALQPHMDGLEVFSKRRQKQLQLNLALKSESPGTVDKLDQLRQRLSHFGLEPKLVNYLWSKLGAGVNWMADLDQQLDTLLTIQNSQDLTTKLGLKSNMQPNLLNYVLSSPSITPGYTDITVVEQLRKQVPLEPWMLDEGWLLNQIGHDGSWRDDFIAAVDANPPPLPDFPSIAAINEHMAEHQVLFTFGKLDSFLDQPLQLKNAKRFSVPGHVEFAVFDGGHGAAFSAQGAEFVGKWAQKQL